MEQHKEKRQPYAVIFVSRLAANSDGYRELAEEMLRLAEQQPGFLGVNSARGEDGLGITVSYWQSLEAIAAWKSHPAHLKAQQAGREHFYDHLTLHVVRIERSHSFSAVESVP